MQIINEEQSKQWSLIQYLTDRLISTNGVEAVYLKGSIARGTDDDYSDVDFYCMVKPENFDEMLKMRHDILDSYKPILYKSEVDFGNPQIIVIYGDNVHLDFYVTKEAPTYGYDCLNVLYDPNSRLRNYQIFKRPIDENVIQEHMNEAIYMLQEFYAAYMRGDWIWTGRLLSHMLTEIGLAYSAIYYKGHPVEHLKGLYFKLPKEIQEELLEIQNMMVQTSYLGCCKSLISQCEKIIGSLDAAQRTQIFESYLNYMKNLLADKTDSLLE